MSLRITEDTILQSLTNVQESLLTSPDGARYGPAFVPRGTHHLTVLLLSLQHADQEALAAHVMNEAQHEIHQLVQSYAQQKVQRESNAASDTTNGPLALRLHGLGHFGHKVLFANVHSQPPAASIPRDPAETTNLSQSSAADTSAAQDSHLALQALHHVSRVLAARFKDAGRVLVWSCRFMCTWPVLLGCHLCVLCRTHCVQRGKSAA